MASSIGPATPRNPEKPDASLPAYVTPDAAPRVYTTPDAAPPSTPDAAPHAYVITDPNGGIHVVNQPARSKITSLVSPHETFHPFGISESEPKEARRTRDFSDSKASAIGPAILGGRRMPRPKPLTNVEKSELKLRVEVDSPVLSSISPKGANFSTSSPSKTFTTLSSPSPQPNVRGLEKYKDPRTSIAESETTKDELIKTTEKLKAQEFSALSSSERSHQVKVMQREVFSKTSKKLDDFEFDEKVGNASARLELKEEIEEENKGLRIRLKALMIPANRAEVEEQEQLIVKFKENLKLIRYLEAKNAYAGVIGIRQKELTEERSHHSDKITKRREIALEQTLKLCESLLNPNFDAIVEKEANQEIERISQNALHDAGVKLRKKT